MLTDTLQHVHKVVIRVDVVQAAGRQQALHDADVFRAQFGPAEQPVLLTHRDHPQNAAMLLPLTACRAKWLRQVASFALSDSSLPISPPFLNSEWIVPSCQFRRYNAAHEPLTAIRRWEQHFLRISPFPRRLVHPPV